MGVGIDKSKKFLKKSKDFEGGEELVPEFDPLAAFNKSILDQTKHYPPPPPLMYFVQKGEKFPHRTKKSFSLQQGKQKSKKTTALGIEVAAYINPIENHDTLHFECAEPGVVIFFDCEQGESYAARTMHLILKMAGVESHPNLIYCDLRELNPSERLLTIEAAIQTTPNIKWAIIDGLVDIMNDFMSAEEAHMVMTQILKMCSKYDIHITGVLHQNKGISKDARAHIGSIAGQKCEVEIMVERDTENKELSVISAKESRGLPFEDFAIRWEKGGLPYIVQDWCQHTTTHTGRQISKTPYDTDHDVHLKLLKSCFNNNPTKMKRSELNPAIVSTVSAYQELKQPIGRDKANMWIAHWIDVGYLDHEGTEGTKSSKFFIKYDAFK